MDLNEIQKLIVDLINEYDNQGYIIDEKLLAKYTSRIKKMTLSNIEDINVKFELEDDIPMCPKDLTINDIKNAINKYEEWLLTNK